MKILSSAPLLVAGTAIVTVLVALVTNVRLASPDLLGLGLGIATCVGLFAMLARDVAACDRCN